MRRVTRTSGRVLSAILTAAMIVTSVPVTGVPIYATETTTQIEEVSAQEITTDATAVETAETSEGSEGKGAAGASTPSGDDGAAQESGTSGDAGIGETAGNVSEAENPSTPGDGSATENPETPSTPGDGSAVENPDTPATPGTTENPEIPVNPDPADATGDAENAGDVTTEDGEASDAATTEPTEEDAVAAGTLPEDSAAEVTTEPAEDDKTDETEETDKDTNDPYLGFPGLDESYTLTADQIEGKEALEEHLGEQIPEDLTAELYEDAEDLYVLGQVVCEADSESEAEAYAVAFNGELASYSYGIAVIRLAEEDTVAKAVAASANADTLLPAVWPDYYHELDDAASLYNDPKNDFQWQHEYLGDSYAWTAGYKGQGIKVAVIDTGLRESHEDLKANALPGRDFADGATGGSHSSDNQTHGTHVAGIIAAVANNGVGGSGVAPEAQVSGYCVFPTSGSARGSDIIRAINAAVSAGYDIINMSLGSAQYSQLEANAVKKAYQSGVAVFAAAGNEASNSRHYPAAYPGVISVASIQQYGSMSTFTNYGSTVDLAFPGSSIYSTLPGSDRQYGYKSGTSMACPAAAGAAAVILSARSDIRNKSGKTRVDALLSVMKKGAIKVAGTSSGMGAGTTYLPSALGLSTMTTAPVTPSITIDGPLDSTGKSYTAESVTATISVTSQDALEIYYSTNGKTPTYKNGMVTNGTLLEDTTENGAVLSGAVELTGARKVTLKAMSLNPQTGKVSKIVTKTVSLAPIPTSVTITQANNVKNIKAGGKLALKATVTPGYAVSTKVQWSIMEEVQPAGMSVKNGTVTTSTKTPSGYYVIQATAVGADGKTYDGVRGYYKVHVLNAEQLSPYQVASYRLNPNKISLDLVHNTTYDLAGAVQITLKAGATKVPPVAWTSSNTAVATVSNKGVVTAVSKGKATITGTLNDGSGKKATCIVTVTSPVTSIEISGPTQVAAGKSIQLKANVLPTTATNRKVNWSVLDNSLVTVKNGKVTARKGATGTCSVVATAADGSGTTSYEYLITITSGAITRIALVDEENGPVKSVALFKSTDEYNMFATSSVLLADVYGEGADTRAVEFSSSAPGIVSVEQEGNEVTLTARAIGKATITCAATDGSGKKATCKVSVSVPMSGIMISAANGYQDTVAPGKSLQLAVRYGTRYGTPTSKKVVWASSDPSIIKVSQSGKVTAAKTAQAGDWATITCASTDGSGVTGYYYVDVIQPAKSIAITKYSTTGLMIKTYEADGTERTSGLSYDVKISGKGASCKVEQVNGKYYIWPTLVYVTYPSSGSLPSKLASKYKQKVTITVTLKDGSGLKKTTSVYVAQNRYGNIRIY